MTMQETKTSRNDQDLVREKDGKQIAIGFYNLIQAGIQTGRLLVLADGNLMVEHWDLWQAFRQPSWANSLQEIRFEYVGDTMNLGEFRSGIGQNSTYIIARCEQVTL